MNLRISSRTRIAFGQVALLASVLMCAVALGLVPNPRDAVARGRAALCESIAVSSSVLAQRDDLAGLQAALEGIARRDAQILSAAVRRDDGTVVAVTGDHDAHWKARRAASDASFVHVPIYSNRQRWGTVELRMTATTATGPMGFLLRPDVKLIGFVSLGCFVLYLYYLRKVLQHLDPSKVVPGRVRSALDTLAEGLLVLDAKGRIVLANQAFAALVGRRPEELLGVRAETLPWIARAADAGAAAQGDATTAAAATVLPWAEDRSGGEAQRNRQIRLRDAQGTVRTFVVNCSPVLGHDGKHRGVLASFEDVTQLESQKVELAGARDAAEAANRAKSEFLARMSHEIRTPMNAILGFADVLRRGYEQSAQERQEYLETIHSSGQHLLELINDILDLSKIESGRIQVERARCSPHHLISDVVAVLGGRAREKGIALDYEWSGGDGVPGTIETDETRLRQILTNLVGNAIKFTGQGGVRVVARLDAGRQKLAIDVTDTGIGIAPEDAARLFQPFVQADTSITRRFGGTGLGLAISRQLAQALGGDIAIHSELGKGSRFTVTIDTGSLDGVAVLDAAPQTVLAGHGNLGVADGAELRLPPLRILSVDDGQSNQKLIRLVLGRAGAVVIDAAFNGSEGMEKALAGDYDIVLMDMQMPVMDGFTAASLLRQKGYAKPILALTANAMKGEEERCRAAGCSGFVPKPIEMEVLVRAIAQAVGAEAAIVPAESARPRSAVAAEPPRADALRSTLPVEDPDFREIVDEFVDRLKVQMNDLQSAWEHREIDRVESLAHWIKGSGGTAGFNSFTAPAQRLEQQARDARVDQIEDTIAEIRSLVDRVAVSADEAGPTGSPGQVSQPQGQQRAS